MSTPFDPAPLTRDASPASNWVDRLSSSALDRLLDIDAEIECAGVAFTGIEPAIALWMAPELVDTVCALHRLAMETIAEVATACAARNQLLDRARAQQLLEDTLGNWLDARPALGLWIEWSADEAGRLRLRATPAGRAGAMPARARLRLRFGRDGRHEHVMLPVASTPRLAVAMDWLRGDRPDGLEEALADSHVIDVLRAFERLGALLPAPSVASAVAADPAALTITHMGHAFVIAEYGGRRLLVDPVLHASHDGQEVSPATSRELGHVDAIFFTHHHFDHMLPATLLQLPHGTPVFVPAASGRAFTPRAADFIRLMGFRDVRELRPGDTHEVGAGLSVQAVPFTGEGSGVLHFDACAYVVTTPAGRALFHADAAPGNDGESIVSSGALDALVARDGPIDAVFGTWWQERRFLIGLSPLVFVMDHIGARDWLRDVEFCDCSPAFLSALVGGAGARLFVTYAEGNEEGFLPADRVSAATPVASFLWRSREEVCRAIEQATGVQTVAAQPFLRLSLRRGAPPSIDGARVGRSRARFLLSDAPARASAGE